MFTLSEYYDRDRPAYYDAIRTVRQNDMGMTVWPEYFVESLATQLRELPECGELVIRRDLRDCQPATTAWAATRTGGKVIASIMHGPPWWRRSDNPSCGRTARSKPAQD